MVNFVTTSLRAMALAGAVTTMTATCALAEDPANTEEIGAIQRQIENSQARQTEIAGDIQSVIRGSITDSHITVHKDG